MARLWQGGAELNSTTTDVEMSSNTGTISSTTVRSGAYSWRANPTASTGFFRFVVFASDQSTLAYLRVYVNIATLPASDTNIIRFANTANGTCARIDLTSGGLLKLKNTNNVQVGSSSSALSTGTWYMVELKLDASSSPGSIEGKLDGVSFASGANASQQPWARVLWGVITTETADIFFDDCAVNDSSGSAQTGYPGPGKIIHLKPNATGDSNQWNNTSNAAGDSNNFNLVDEVPPDDATTMVQTGTVNQIDMYNIENSGINSYDTVNVVMVGGRFRNNTSDTTTAFRLRIEKTASGTVLESADIVPNNGTWLTNAAASPRNYPIITYQDPDAAAWTSTTLDSMQIGAKLTVANVNRVQLSTVWASVDYTPGSPPGGAITGFFF